MSNVRDDHDGQIAGNRAGVVVALDDEAGHRGAERGVALHFASATHGRFGLGDVRFREVALRDRRAMCRLRGVEPLARKSAAFEQRLRALVLEHRVGERCLRAFERGLRHTDGCRRRVELRVHFAAIDGGDDLAFGDAVADIDEHALEPAGQLRLDADASSCRQRARDFERRFDRADRGADDRDVDDRRRRSDARGGIGSR